jgi:cbb3-type cytochrome oxidase subunit 3
MKLSDIVAHAGLALYAEVALVLFVLVFLAVMLRTWRPSRREELESLKMLPLETDRPAGPREGGAR